MQNSSQTIELRNKAKPPSSMTSLADAIRAASQRRQALHDDSEQTAYRVFHGYGEGFAGVTVDRYADVAVLSHKVEVPDHVRDAAAKALLETVPIEVRDLGLRFVTRVHTRQASGLYLDARPARAWIRRNASGRRILNLFAYTGSLGVAAAAGGACSVVHVDNKNRPLKIAWQNHRLNQLPIDDRDLLCCNVYTHLPRAHKAGCLVDGIILDPPPRVPVNTGRQPAVGQDYAQLAPLVAPLLESGGWLLCFFNRPDRSREQMETQIIERASVPLQVMWRGQSGEDFPEADRERKLRLTAFRRV